MKILYIIHKFPEVSQTFIRNQIHDMVKRGHEVSILCTFDETEKFKDDPTFQNNIFPSLTHGDGYPSSALKWILWAFIQLGRSLRNPTFWRALKYLPIRDIGRQVVHLNQLLYYSKSFPEPDVIHGHFAINAVALAALRKVGIFKSSRLIVSFHGCDLHHFAASTYTHLIQETNAFTVNSKFSMQKALALGCPEKKISIVPVSFDDDLFRPSQEALPSNEHTIRILFVGRLCELKGPHIALDAFRILDKKGDYSLHFDIVGTGKMHRHLQEKVEDWNLFDSVTLHGALNPAAIRDLMDDADIFLFPGIADKHGIQEAQGLVVQEAQAMELPVITSNTGGVPEGLLDGVSGFVVEQKDVDSIVAKLGLLCDNNALRQSMGTAGRNFVSANYSQKTIGNKLESIYLSSE